MRHRHLAVAILTVALAACTGGEAAQPLAEDLQRDLEMARGTAVEMAPSGGRQVVSAIELTPPAPRPRPTERVARRSPRPTPPQPASAPMAAAPTPTPEVTAQVPVATRDTTAKVGTARPVPPAAVERRAPPGGWRSPSEVIRNAPFPINP